MNLIINLEGIQEDKKYVLEFCLTSDGKRIVNYDDISKNKEPKKKTSNNEPVLEKPVFDKPALENTNSTKEINTFKIESSFGDKKIDPTN